MTKTAAFLAAVLLAGCMTGTPVERQQMPDKEPHATYTTAKSLAETAECIETGVRAVSDAGHAVSAAENGEARILWVTTLANPVIAVRMEPVEAGTYVEYRTRFRTGSGSFTNAVMACR